MTRQEHITEEDEKEKYIESIKKPLGCDYDYCLSCYTHARKSCMLRPQAEALYKAGYRKANDVIEEVISSVKSIIKTEQMCKDVFLSVENYEWLWNRLTELADEMRQEV